MRKNKINIILSVLLAVFVTFFVFAPQVAIAEEKKVEYTDVLTDLSQDKTFSLSDYPAIGKDNSLSVIHIAESVNKELFVYVYQPSAYARYLTASELRMGIPEVGKDTIYKDYKLTLLSRNGVLQKYKVENFTVKSASARYYDIVQITRPFDSAIDTALNNDNTASNVVYEVAQKWEMVTANGTVTTRMLELEVITITDKFVGFVRYWDGLNWIPSYTDSHFVAFSTDRDIETLLEADISFFKQPYEEILVDGSEADFTLGEGELVPLKTLELTNESSNEADGLFGKKYTWREIESTTSFLAEMDELEVHITNEGALALENTQWVLRFEETVFTKSLMHGFVHYVTGTLVSDVTILRLKFETEGEVYNLGVIDNKQTGSSEPVGTVGGLDFSGLFDDLSNLLKLVVLVIGAVILISLALPFLPMVGSLFVWLLKIVVKALIWLVLLPFKLVIGIFKAIFKKKKD